MKNTFLFPIRNKDNTVRFVLVFFFFISALSFIYANALDAQGVIKDIKIIGNKIVSDSKILSTIKTRVGEEFNENVINSDIKNLYATGSFENIEVEHELTDEGITVLFICQERPLVKAIAIEGARGNRKRRVESLITIKQGEFLDEYKVRQIQQSIKDFYYKRGFSEATVDYIVNLDDSQEATIIFSIEEKGVIRVEKIFVKGVESFSEKKILKLLRTKKKGFLKRGLFKKETLEDDMRRISDFYKERGFSEVQVDYQLDFIKQYAYITIQIQEGMRYYIGAIKINGNEKVSQDLLLKQLTFKEGDVFVEKNISAALNNLRSVYIDYGYIYVDIQPVVIMNPTTQRIDVTFEITENDIAFVENIQISGNLKTKDKVIRRELRIYPGDKFEGAKIRKSKQRLENLGFFEEIRFDTSPGSKPNWENLLIDVKEARTGYLSFGGGYSSIDEVTGFMEVRQRNFDYRNWSTFTGAGQDLSFTASFGSITERYDLRFVNPWIYDYPLSLGIEAYKRGNQREEDVGYAFEEDTRGGALKFGKEFTDEFKAWLGYRLEKVEISDIVDTASQALKDEAGSNNLSTLEFDMSYDLRDNVFNTTRGYVWTNSFQFTGGFLGGDKDFYRFSTRFSKFFPLPRKSVLEFRVRAGLSDTFSHTNKIPIYKRFFAGGISTIRGYHERKIGPIDLITEDPIGGESLFVGNIEYTYPLIDILRVAFFFDTGNVWEKNSDFLSGNLKSSVGTGIRVKTPLGPLSLDYGWPLNVEPGEEGKEGRFHFSISRGF